MSEWLWGQVGSGPAPQMTVPMELAQTLRYGENPHQVGRLHSHGLVTQLAMVVCMLLVGVGTPSLPYAILNTIRIRCSFFPRPPHSFSASLLTRLFSYIVYRMWCMTSCPQAAAFYTDQSLREAGAGGVATSVVHWGKEMSYNNYLVRGLGRNGCSVCCVRSMHTH